MNFVWDWCGLCEFAYIVCPKCGNNSCNGGWGELENGEECDICALCYKYQHLSWITGMYPRNKDELDKYNHGDYEKIFKDNMTRAAI